MKEFMASLSDDKEAELFTLLTQHLDILTTFGSPYFKNIHPELQLNKANATDSKAPFLDLHLLFSDGFGFTRIYDKRDD